MKRPLIPVALFYVAGILLAALPVSLAALFIVAFALLMIFAVWPAVRTVVLCVLVILAGWINLAQRTAILSPHDLRSIVGDSETKASVRGVLHETPSHHVHVSHRERYTNTIAQMDVLEIKFPLRDPQPASGRIILSTSRDLQQNFFGGQVVEIVGTIKRPPGAAADGLFDYRNYLANQGIYYELTTQFTNDWAAIEPRVSPPLADRFRGWARKTLALGLPGEDESLYLEWALTLGWKTALTDDVFDPFIKASTYHIFAVDGLRIAIV